MVLAIAAGMLLSGWRTEATVTWTNTAGNWEEAYNWSPNQVPTAGDDVVNPMPPI